MLLCSATALAQSAYTWTDAEGRKHFGDRPPPGSHASEVEIRVNTYSAPAIFSQDNTALNNGAAVVLYSTQRCGYCRQAKAFMARNAIPYQEYDVETSPRGRRDYKQLKGRGVPIILVGKQRMNGYSEAHLASLLRDAGYLP